MVLRYAHLANDQLYHAADKIDLPEVKTAGDRTPWVTNQLRCNVVPLPARSRRGS